MTYKSGITDVYYYVDGKFVERTDGRLSTRQKIARRYKAKLDKVVPYRHSIIGQTKKVYLKTKKGR